MALFQPTNIIPDVRTGIGLGVADVSQDLQVTWRINGPSAMTKWQVRLFTADGTNTEIVRYTKILTTPVYGMSSTGEVQLFTGTVPASILSGAGMSNGNSYMLLISQYWNDLGVEKEIVQSSGSLFYARSTPVVSINTIGTSGVVTDRSYTFTASYQQAQGDLLDSFRWQIAYADNTEEPFFDSGNIFGTMDLQCSYDGFLTGQSYAIRFSCQSVRGARADTGWVSFSCTYPTTDSEGYVQAGCVGGTDAVMVTWYGTNYSPGTASGSYTISSGRLVPGSGTTVTWDEMNSGSMSITTPSAFLIRFSLPGTGNSQILKIDMEGGHSLTMSYNWFSSTNKGVRFYYDGEALSLGWQNVGSGAGDIIIFVSPSGVLYRTVGYPYVNQYYDIPAAAGYVQGNMESIQIAAPISIDYIQVIEGNTDTYQSVMDQISALTYSPTWDDPGCVFLADFQTNSLDSKQSVYDTDTITGFSIYRQQSTDQYLTHIGDTDSNVFSLYDYGARSQQGPYIYYVFPNSSVYFAPIYSGQVIPCWWNWTLMDCEETDDKNIFTVRAAYRFRLNIDSGTISNNNSPNVLNNFTPYPTVQLAPQNYKGGTLTGLIGAVSLTDGKIEYIDTLAWRDAIYALSVSQRPLFLKSRKGDLIRIKISGPITVKTADETREQVQTVTIPWVETGDATRSSLYSTQYVGVQSAKGALKAQQMMDTSDATAEEDDIRIGMTAYARGEKITGDAEMYVEGTTLFIPGGWIEVNQ